MNKLILTTVMACGLLLLESPEAAAHEESYSQQRSQHVDRSDYYRRDAQGRHEYRHHGYRHDYHSKHKARKAKRESQMPRWLRKDRSFRHWYEHTRLRSDRHISWNQLFDIYRWERFYFGYGRY
jgi:hypothetical protein